MPRAIDVIRRAQATSLLGTPYERPNADEHNAPYLQLGADKQPYDLGHPTALRELKHALHALGKRAADPIWFPADPAIETRWQDIVLEEDVPSWDAAAADEFAIAIGRHRGWGWQVPGPYALMTPGGPQPTATGLELIAGAVNQLLGGVPKMAHYEAWRGGMYAPPSMISSPEPEDPVAAASFFGPQFKLPPPETEPELMAEIQKAEADLKAAWAGAMDADNEGDRAGYGGAMVLARSMRDALVDQAIAAAPIRIGETAIEHVAPLACQRLGGQWSATENRCVRPEPAEKAGAGLKLALPLAVLGGVALLVGVSSRPSARPSRLTGGLARR